MTQPLGMLSIAETIKEFGISQKKSLGQHFIVNENICKNIVNAAGDLKNFNILEVGPGPGGLTRELLKSQARQIVVVEKDSRCINALECLALNTKGNLRIEKTDALNFNIVKELNYPRKIIANLPFNIATELLIKWLSQTKNINQMILMFQKEVARRIVAQAGTAEYGRLSIKVQLLCKCELLFELKSGSFAPPPKVDASIIRITPYQKPLYDVSQEVLEKVVAAGFGQRRKMLKSSLKSVTRFPEKIIIESGIDPKRRAETLSIEEWCSIANSKLLLEEQMN
tara:strand:- start:123456 stop:124304 length:849 start_codon:yes stop_codon:yes gene_type:complete